MYVPAMIVEAVRVFCFYWRCKSVLFLLTLPGCRLLLLLLVLLLAPPLSLSKAENHKITNFTRMTTVTWFVLDPLKHLISIIHDHTLTAWYHTLLQRDGVYIYKYGHIYIYIYICIKYTWSHSYSVIPHTFTAWWFLHVHVWTSIIYLHQ